MEVLLDIAGKFGAASAPILAFFLWREVQRNDKLEGDRNTMSQKVENLAERCLTANLETKHALAAFTSILTSKAP